MNRCNLIIVSISDSSYKKTFIFVNNAKLPAKRKNKSLQYNMGSSVMKNSCNSAINASSLMCFKNKQVIKR
jgi:hypothetical protein